MTTWYSEVARHAKALRALHICQACEGSGVRIVGRTWVACPDCHGTGRLLSSQTRRVA